MEERELIARLERVWARDAVAFARVLAAQDPSWRTETLALAGGQLVLCGAGLYVNRGLALGIDPPLRSADVGLLLARSAAVGVPPRVEVTAVTHPDSVGLLVEHGFDHVSDDDTTALVRGLDDLPDELRIAGIAVVPVSQCSLEQWQEVSALGWGHATPQARRPADVFAAVAHVVDGDGMVLAIDSDDGRPLGCASLTIRDEVATLGGMSTIPAERGRGVQAALILHRLGVARDSGCSLAAATTVTGGASQRNVMRHGFRPLHVKQSWVRQ